MGANDMSSFRIEYAVMILQGVGLFLQVYVAGQIANAEKRMEQRLSQHVVDYHRKGAV